MSIKNLSRRRFIAAATAAAGFAALSPEGLLGQDPVIDSLNSRGQTPNRERVPWAAEPFPMKQVRLLNGRTWVNADHAKRVVARVLEAMGRLRRRDHDVTFDHGQLLFADRERHQFELEGLVGGNNHDVRTDQKRER